MTKRGSCAFAAKTTHKRAKAQVQRARLFPEGGWDGSIRSSAVGIHSRDPYYFVDHEVDNAVSRARRLDKVLVIDGSD